MICCDVISLMRSFFIYSFFITVWNFNFANEMYIDNCMYIFFLFVKTRDKKFDL